MNKKYWVAFSSIAQVGSVFINKVYNHFKNIEKAFNAGLSEFSEIEGLKKKSVEDFLRLRDKIDFDKLLTAVSMRGLKVLTLEDEKYPIMLKEIYNPPPVLYVKGDLDCCNLEKTLAVVGSRRASTNGRRNLARIISEFNLTDVCIVSGLASGIDTVAHISALETGLKTIGVIASGFDFTYPNANKGLYKQIEEGGGAILTEYYPTFEPLKFRFPERNRIVTGLSYGTLVAEAALKSGALISANLTLEQGRELMCMPGEISNPNTEGVYKLLKQGATMVTSAQDILETLNWNVNLVQKEEKDYSSLSEIELKILDSLKIEEKDFDDIQIETGISTNDLLTNLTILELKGIIKQVIGDKYLIN